MPGRRGAGIELLWRESLERRLETRGDAVWRFSRALAARFFERALSTTPREITITLTSFALPTATSSGSKNDRLFSRLVLCANQCTSPKRSGKQYRTKWTSSDIFRCKAHTQKVQIVGIVVMEPSRRKLRLQVFSMFRWICAHLNAFTSVDNWSLGAS